ncbi:MAG: Major Facilitator Superfamily protein [bacterium ADurb.Bin429]|nr:MAG: Major Facilitator Superfamily protein [bacterium ADurb.Bin429]
MIEDTDTVPMTAVTRAMKLTYLQAMLGAASVALTGGAFITGFALKLGADTIHIGLMSTLPMLCILVQLLASAVVERGADRRRMTIIWSLGGVAGWAGILCIPLLGGVVALPQIWLLIGMLTLMTLFAYIAGSARGSWVGDLIPEAMRGAFFGNLFMYSAIVSGAFGLLGGVLMDYLKDREATAFCTLFAIGAGLGLVSVLLYLPQPHVRPARASEDGFRAHLRATFANRPFMVVMLYALLWSLQSIAWPFYATYMLDTVKMSYFWISVTGISAMLTMVLTAPFWGRVVDRYGCRPVLVACTAACVPLPLIWFWLETPLAVTVVVSTVNILGGALGAGISVALSTLVYKATPSAGRAVQFAIYSILVTLAAAPMPTLGGALPGLLARWGITADIRVTFYACIPLILAALFAARAIREAGAGATVELVRRLPFHLRRPASLHAA